MITTRALVPESWSDRSTGTSAASRSPQAKGLGKPSKVCTKGDPEAKALTLNQSPVAALASASEITGLPRDNFEVHEISKEEFERLRA